MNEITNDWPTDSQNEELARLADQMQCAIPSLSVDAMARIERRMRAELDRIERRQRWRNVGFGAGLAASILLAIGGYVFLRPDQTAPVALQPLVKSTPLEEQITIAVSVPSRTPTPEKALVRLDEYRSLFAD